MSFAGLARAARALVLGVAVCPAPAAALPPAPPSADPAHPWLSTLSAEVPHVPLATHFRPPAGFVPEPAPAGSFARFLRTLPVRQDRRTVLDFRGEPLFRPAAAAAVIYLDVGDRDLQQCADTALRLFAEWRWQAGLAGRSAFHFTSGDVTRFSDWVNGERITAAGRGITRRAGARRAADHRSHRAWLDLVFRYAGTRSLAFDTDAVPKGAPLAAGDLFVDPGSPGHAVILLDVARHPDGRSAALVGQGFMPAQDLHVLGADAPVALDGVWFILPGPDGELSTPAWRPFPRASARRFRGT
ncbi:DUF4846 domain-containing protein [Myxococcota bacterium]|nr:DUF4846 domain-containing protein [Myxococcota bacterium]